LKPRGNPNNNIKLKGAILMRISKDMQDKVDEYIELDAKVKTLTAHLKALRKEVEPYMKDRGLTVIPGSLRGSISLQPKNLAIMNSRFTSYDTTGVLTLLDKSAIDQCITEVVDKDVLELLVKTGKAPKEVDNFKLYNQTLAFTINHK
jgi:hypothetical protein